MTKYRLKKPPKPIMRRKTARAVKPSKLSRFKLYFEKL